MKNIVSIFVHPLKITLILLIALAACKKEEIVTEKIDNKISLDKYQIESINEVREIFSKSLSKALNNAELRSFLKQKLSKYNDNSYEFIYVAEMNEIVTNGMTLAEFLTANTDPSVFEDYGIDFFKKIINIDPLLALAIPDLDKFDAQTWNANIIPSVVAVLEGPGL